MKKTEEALTMGSLFDGIGGFPLAAVRNGIIPVWASEIEAFPIEVTKLRFPEMVHVGDITQLDGAKLPPVHIICGGSPCQDPVSYTHLHECPLWFLCPAYSPPVRISDPVYCLGLFGTSLRYMHRRPHSHIFRN